MALVRWVCMSDMHFGAENSLLSHVPEGSIDVDPQHPSAVLVALVDCLRTLCAVEAGEGRPTLVLNGDILEMALARDEVAAMAFDRFVDLAFGSGAPIFDDTVVYVPGNHDHHLWETARERQYAAYVAAVPTGQPLGPPWHATRLFESDDLAWPEAELLTALVRRRAGLDLRVKIAYPNLGVRSEGTGRTVLFHHGHFVEPLYRLMSSLKDIVFPRQPTGLEIWDWEADNFAWIDFLWSTLGRSGEVGRDMGLVYDMLQSDEALAILADDVGTASTRTLPATVRPETAALVRVVLRVVATHVARHERADPTQLLGPSATAGLRDYVTGPLLRQLEREHPGAAEGPVSFVFGHTHKPYESVEHLPGLTQSVQVFNSGGWVVDTERTASLQGASVVVVDDDCRVASVRLYNQADDPSGYRVRLAPPAAGPTDALHDGLARVIDPGAPPWSGFSEAVARAVAQRRAILPDIIERGVELTRPVEAVHR
ncbi:MAG: hypothetical protein ABSG81_03905 [Acidimicrobiales bacterium]